MENRIELKGKNRKYFKITGYLLSYVIVMFWGMAFVRYQVPPYGVYVWVKQVLALPRYMGPEAEILERFGFTGALVEPKNQIYSAIQNMEQVDERVKELELDVELFPNAFESLHVLNTSFVKPHIFTLIFELGREYTTYCYFEKSLSAGHRTAILLIPGSGANQSSAILPGGLRNYHDGLYEIAHKYGDVYVYIKPNEDIRAIHNGHHKLDWNFITNTLISHGASYSAYYIVETIAITKFLQQTYERVVVAGVSQGATAASLNAFQSWPSAVICISGGYYPSDDFVSHASPFNIMIPGLNKIVEPNSVPALIRNHSTRWLFTLGKLDIGEFRVLAEENILTQYFQGIDQVTIKTHKGAHSVPSQILDDYLNKMLLRK